MADSTSTTKQVQYEIILKNSSGTQASRTVTFDTLFEADVTLGQNARAVATSLYGGPFDWIIQPTNWRDSDTAEEAYQVDSVVTKLITKTVTTLE